MLFSRVLPDRHYVNRMAGKGVSHVEQTEDQKRPLQHKGAEMAKQEETFFAPAHNNRRR